MTNQQMSRQSGFTLVEIAIVLVIIGLLLGGILKGQEMITQARIKNVANDFNGITAAYFSYQDRYKAVPGDDGGANPRWAASKNGTGDGTLSGLYSDYVAGDPAVTLTVSAVTGETLNFWWHLRLSGFVPGPTAGPGAASNPTNAVGGIVGVQSGALGLSGISMCSAGIPDKVAIAVDTQLDDQKRLTGTLRGVLVAANPQPVAAVPAGAEYQETGSNQYVICRSI